VIVQPTAYGNETAVRLKAMQELADDMHQLRGRDHPANPQIRMPRSRGLNRLGMRGLRYHMLHGGGVTWESLPAMAARVAAHGWHVQVQMDGGEFRRARRRWPHCPATWSSTTSAVFALPLAPDDANWKALRRLVDGGRCWAKLSAPYHGSKKGPPVMTMPRRWPPNSIRAAPERMLYATKLAPSLAEEQSAG